MCSLTGIDRRRPQTRVRCAPPSRAAARTALAAPPCAGKSSCPRRATAAMHRSRARGSVHSAECSHVRGSARELVPRRPGGRDRAGPVEGCCDTRRAREPCARAALCHCPPEALTTAAPWRRTTADARAANRGAGARYRSRLPAGRIAGSSRRRHAELAARQVPLSTSRRPLSRRVAARPRPLPRAASRSARPRPAELWNSRTAARR